MPTKYMRKVSKHKHSTEKRVIKRAPVDPDESELKYEPEVPRPKSDVADIDGAIAWDWILSSGESE